MTPDHAGGLLRWFVPANTRDWPLVPAQPFLYTSLWIGSALTIWPGDAFSEPPHHRDIIGGVPPAWIVLALLCPPMALAALRMLRGSGRMKYAAFWVRFGADVGMLIAVTSYLWLRFTEGDYHIIPVTALVGAALFITALVMRDIAVIVANEKLATQIQAGHLDVGR